MDQRSELVTIVRIPSNIRMNVEDMPGRYWEFTVPLDWTYLSFHSNSILKFFELPNGARVGVNAFSYHGAIWIHASISRPDRLPDYADLCYLKEVVFGPHRVCAQVFEETEHHVNIHPNCLHLWGPNFSSNWPLPRFTEGTI